MNFSVSCLLLLVFFLSVCSGNLIFPRNNPAKNPSKSHQIMSQLEDEMNQQFEEFQRWAAVNSKNYSETEVKRRHLQYLENKKLIEEHNQNADLYGYQLELNEYADLNHDEFFDSYLSKLSPSKKLSSSSSSKTVFLKSLSPELENWLPESVDWRQKHVVVPPLNQGKCGSCWTFSSIAALESHHAIRTGKLVKLSEQQVLDCASNPTYGNQGCDGGVLDQAFRYIRDSQGVVSFKSYPYTGVQGKCHTNPFAVVANITGWFDIPFGDEETLKEMVATKGPVAVAIHVSNKFKFYKSGVYYEPGCLNSLDQLNHGVVVIGYGTDSHARDYWLIKNSWGAEWGLEGTIKIARNRANHCGVASQAVLPIGVD
eukprot:Sdes_comp19714_c0_seq2m11655